MLMLLVENVITLPHLRSYSTSASEQEKTKICKTVRRHLFIYFSCIDGEYLLLFVYWVVDDVVASGTGPLWIKGCTNCRLSNRSSTVKEIDQSIN